MKALADKLEARRSELKIPKDKIREELAMGSTQITAVFKGDWDSLNWATIDRVRKHLGINDEDWLGMKSETQLLTGMDQKLDRILSIVGAEGAAFDPDVPSTMLGSRTDQFSQRREALRSVSRTLDKLEDKQAEKQQKKAPEQHQEPPAKDSRRDTKKRGR